MRPYEYCPGLSVAVNCHMSHKLFKYSSQHQLSSTRLLSSGDKGKFNARVGTGECWSTLVRNIIFCKMGLST
jgi:hypothetical protein